MARCANELGYANSYEPSLRLEHFITAPRLKSEYLRRLIEGFGRSYVILHRVLDQPLDPVPIDRLSAWLTDSYRHRVETEGRALGAEDLERLAGAGAHHGTVAAHLARGGRGLLPVRRSRAGAVHVDREGDVAELGDFVGAVLGVVVQAPPFVHHHHAGALALEAVVPDQITLMRLAVDLIVDGLFFQFGLSGDADRGEQESGREKQGAGWHGSNSFGWVNADSRPCSMY